MHFVEAGGSASPQPDRPPTQEKLLHHSRTARTSRAATKVDCYSPAQRSICACVCVYSLTHTHMLMCGLTVIQWTAGSSSSGGQGSPPRRRSSDSEGVFPGDAPGDETAGLLYLVLISGPCCCFMNPLLHTSTQPEQPFVILIVHL